MTNNERLNFNKVLAIANHDYHVKGHNMTLLVRDRKYTLRVWAAKRNGGQPFVVIDDNWVYFEGVTTHPELVDKEAL